MHDRTPAQRCARTLLSLFHKRSEPRLSPSEQNFRREEVNRVLGEMGDEAINQTLTAVYRLAELEARRSARRVDRMIHPPATKHWLSSLFQRFYFLRRRGPL